MEINGIFVKSLPKTEGESARGPWVRGGFVIEYGEEYPRKVAFSLFGEDKAAMADKIPEGVGVTVRFSPESREFNERWYTELRCISVVPLAQGAARQPYQAPVTQTAQYPAQTRPTGGPQMPGGEYKDLPF